VFHKILAAVDRSPRAQGVARAALEIAQRFDGHVHFYTALAMPPDLPPAAATRPDGLEEYLLAQARERLTQLAEQSQLATVEPPAVLTGQPWRDIIATAERLHADLVVIGSHGFGGWDRVLGTTAGKIANHSRCPVLIVHEPPAGAS
jgi:nucleotide-binding universal stress UspA family protein